MPAHHDLIRIALSGFLASSVTMVSALLLMPIAFKVGLLDQPGGRKQHLTPTPLIGGVAICFGLLTGLMGMWESIGRFQALFLSCALIVTVGLFDDFKERPANVRLLVQTLIALILMLFGDTELVNLGNLFGLGVMQLNWLQADCLTAVSIIGLMNAYNMIDGADGVAVGICFTQTLCLLILISGQLPLEYTMLITLVIGCLLGFMPFNYPFKMHNHARAFLGDAGSLLLGLIMVWLSIHITQTQSTQSIYPVTMLWIFAYPLLEAISSIYIRFVEKRSIFRPDRQHFHHLLEKQGCKTRSIAYITSLSSLCIGGAGIVMQNQEAPEWLMLVGFVVLAFLSIFSKLTFLGKQAH